MSYKNKVDIVKSFDISNYPQSIGHWDTSAVNSYYSKEKSFGIFSINANEGLSSYAEISRYFLKGKLDIELQNDFLVDHKDPRQTYSHVKSEESSTDLSNYAITSEGIFAEKWDTILNIEARIVKCGIEKVVVECLVDSNEMRFDNRSFDVSFFEGIPTIEKYPVLIKIFKRKNEIKFHVLDGRGLFDASKFEVDPFLDIDLSFLNKKF